MWIHFLDLFALKQRKKSVKLKKTVSKNMVHVFLHCEHFNVHNFFSTRIPLSIVRKKINSPCLILSDREKTSLGILIGMLVELTSKLIYIFIPFLIIYLRQKMHFVILTKENKKVFSLTLDQRYLFTKGQSYEIFFTNWF
jgi:hypothetical protein